MKTLRKLFNLVAILVVAVFAFAACVTNQTNDDVVFVPFDISYSTGEAQWDADNQNQTVVQILRHAPRNGSPQFKNRQHRHTQSACRFDI